MTLEEIENSLPNGFHDSEIVSFTVDYLERRATIQLAVFVGELDAPPEKRESYRDASLVISGLFFMVIEPPDAEYPLAKGSSLQIDACMTKALDPKLIAALPAASFVRSFFVFPWNGCIHVAGMDAEIEWTGPVNYRKKREHYLPGETIEL